MSHNKWFFALLMFSLSSSAIAECTKGYDPNDPIIKEFEKARNHKIDKSEWPTNSGLNFTLEVLPPEKKGEPAEINLMIKQLPPSITDQLSASEKRAVKGAIDSEWPFAVYLCKVGNQLQFQFQQDLAKHLGPAVSVTPDPANRRLILQANRPNKAGAAQQFSDYVVVQ